MSNYQRKCTPTEVVSPKQVEDLFSSLVDALQTPETEHTWLQKELELNKLRSMLITYPKWEGDYQIVDRFLNGLRSQGFVDGLVNAMSTLRTTLCITACTTVTELAETFRTDMDQFSEIWIRNLFKLIFQTKRLTLNASSDAIRAILRNSSYSGRLLNTLFTYASEKNPQVRLQISNFFTVILEGHSAKLEKSGGLEIIEKIIEKGVGDANPGVREAARGLFGLYAAKFSDRADRLQQTFSSAARKSLAANSKSRTTSTSSAIKPSAVSHSNKDNLNRSHSTNTRSPCTQRVKTVQTKPLEVATCLMEHSDPQVRLSGIHAICDPTSRNCQVDYSP
ncbi:clasp N terminal-domain-containing protein [Paraphysoderma sedebokerense]|nr:clasp N terminal-domain-containing protein [Paraphysoderma sedebokerense]